VPADSIVAVVSSFYDDDELGRAKIILHDVCVENFKDVDVPRIITHRKNELKRKLDAEDIINYFTLIDEQKFDGKKFVAANLKRLPLIEPGNVDLCFMLESIMDIKKQVASLMNLKDQVQQLNDTVKRGSSIFMPSEARVFGDGGGGSKSVHIKESNQVVKLPSDKLGTGKGE
jgi:hypothetical protein